jgi:tetratricopeptide (TPR) repeat protein
MYLRTPKRYRKPRRNLVSGKVVWLWVVTIAVVIAGWQIYIRRDTLAPPVEAFIGQAIQQAQNTVATASAPTISPTEDPSARVARANAAWDRGAIEEALEEYQAVVDAAPNNALLHQRIVLGLVMQGQADEAVRAAEDAITADPFNADSWAVQALALDRAGRAEEAIPSALQSISLRADNAPALAYMAEAYFDLDRPDLAQETIARALSADPNSYQANYVNALIEWQVNYDLDTASVGFETASAEAPNLPYIAVDRAWFEWNQGNYDTAEGLLSEVLELNPTNLDALYALSFLYYQAYGDPNQSLDYLERCVGADPDNISCLAYLGTVQSALGDTQGSLQSYRRLMGTDTQNPSHFLAAGRAYMNTGDCRSAVPTFQRGYALQQAQDSTNTDRISLFEQYLAECGSPVAAPIAPESTAEPDVAAEAST